MRRMGGSMISNCSLLQVFRSFLCVLLTVVFASNCQRTLAEEASEVVRVFIFAGQSNMVGSDSNSEDISSFPPFSGLDQPQEDVRFSYCLGRENKTKSDGWVSLQPVNKIVGPELSFAREVSRQIQAPLAIIKVAAGGTDLGGDWNPDNPRGFELYPLALEHVRKSLKALEQQGIAYRLEGFMWHQGENDMFNKTYMESYGANLQNFLASWRRDLDSPNLRFYIGELCTKTIWGMDLRPRMYAISLGQKEVAANDPFADYVPTSHVGVKIGGGAGLHYHYGTLGQLEHGVNYAEAYLKSIGQDSKKKRPLKNWPYAAKSKVNLFVLAGHRNMEGERAFIQELEGLEGKSELKTPRAEIALKYWLGGGEKVSDGWEPLGPAGLYDTFGPELSFANTLDQSGVENIAIAKFTHSGSQIIDWTPEGSEAKSRNLYPKFIEFIQAAIAELEDKGHDVEVGGIVYHVGENDMAWGPFRKSAAERVKSLVNQSRVDLRLSSLNWYICQQAPPNHESVNTIDVTAEIQSAIASDPNVVHIRAFDPPPQEKQLVMDTRGIVWLGEQMANSYLKSARKQ